MKYKVGDKLRLTSTEGFYPVGPENYDNHIGIVQTIVEIHGSGTIRTDLLSFSPNSPYDKNCQLVEDESINTNSIDNYYGNLLIN